ncbi:MAG: hypothetical protein LC623_03020 [Halobacteriales archaeon]|nr:hypothetical protein [Halobacteriales archaeon]
MRKAGVDLKVGFGCLSFLAGLAVVLAGCSGKQTETSPSSHSFTSETNPRFQKELQLTNCTSWLVLVNFPAGMAPGQPPPGWQPGSPLNLISRVIMQEYHCNRIAIGPYERGPVNLLLESHTNAAYPANCTSSATVFTNFYVISSLWIDDPDIAGYLNTTMAGLPIHVTSFQVSDQATGPLLDRTWQWGPTQPPSTLTIHDDQRYEAHEPWHDRFFWPRGNGIGVMQIDATGPGAAGPYASRPVEGTMQPPMLLASQNGGRFAGDSQWQPSVDGTGVFTYYLDKACQQPEPQP